MPDQGTSFNFWPLTTDSSPSRTARLERFRRSRNRGQVLRTSGTTFLAGEDRAQTPVVHGRDPVGHRRRRGHSEAHRVQEEVVVLHSTCTAVRSPTRGAPLATPTPLHCEALAFCTTSPTPRNEFAGFSATRREQAGTISKTSAVVGPTTSKCCPPFRPGSDCPRELGHGGPVAKVTASDRSASWFPSS